MVIHYEEALYQVYGLLPLYTFNNTHGPVAVFITMIRPRWKIERVNFRYVSRRMVAPRSNCRLIVDVTAA